MTVYDKEIKLKLNIRLYIKEISYQYTTYWLR